MKNATTNMGGPKATKSPGAPKPAPFYAGAKAHAPSAPKAQPNAPLGANRHVTQDKVPQGKGAANRTSTFQAPRKDHGGDPSDSGYTRIAMSAGSSNGKGNGKR